MKNSPTSDQGGESVPLRSVLILKGGPVVVRVHNGIVRNSQPQSVLRFCVFGGQGFGLRFGEKHDSCAFWLVTCTSTRRNMSDQAKLRNEGRRSNPRTPIRCGPDSSRKRSCCVVMYCCQHLSQGEALLVAEPTKKEGGLEVFWLLVKKLLFFIVTTYYSTTTYYCCCCC